MAWTAIAAGLALALAIGLLAAFFATKNPRYDRVAEWAFVAFAVLAIATMWTAAERLAASGVAITAVTIIGIAGVAALGLGELGSSLRLVDFRRIAGAMALAFQAFLLWVGAISILVVAGDTFPAAFGWLGIVSIVVGIATMLWIIRKPGVMGGEREPGKEMWLFFLPLAGIVVWMIWLGVLLA